MVVGEIQSELDIAPATLSHHQEKLKNEELITVRRESAFAPVHGQHDSFGGTAGVPL
jgi:hypothetical protein